MEQLSKKACACAVANSISIYKIPDEILEIIFGLVALTKQGQITFQEAIPWVSRKWRLLAQRVHPRIGGVIRLPDLKYDYGQNAQKFREELQVFGLTTVKVVGRSSNLFTLYDSRWIPEVDRWCPLIEEMAATFDWTKAPRNIKLRYPRLKHARHYCPRSNTTTLFHSDSVMPHTKEWRQKETARRTQTSAFYH